MQRRHRKFKGCGPGSARPITSLASPRNPKDIFQLIASPSGEHSVPKALWVSHTHLRSVQRGSGLAPYPSQLKSKCLPQPRAPCPMVSICPIRQVKGCRDKRNTGCHPKFPTNRSLKRERVTTQGVCPLPVTHPS